jgi:cytidylate kinase
MPHIIVIQGPLGAGKTTTAAMMAHYYKNIVTNNGGTIQLFSNFGLLGSKEMNDYNNWFDVADANGSICIWDEAHRMIDSRQSLKHENILTTHVLTFARKMAAIQIFVTPHINNLDSRLRQLTEVLINVTKVGNKGMRLEYYDFQAEAQGSKGKFLHARYLPAAKVAKIHSLDLFDSHSFVGGFPLPKNERDSEKFMIELQRRHDIARFKRALNPAEVIAI